jgi:hypothetical protein
VGERERGREGEREREREGEGRRVGRVGREGGERRAWASMSEELVIMDR